MTTDTKKQILQTALKMFLQKSYKEVSLRDIVNEVGLTKGAFYHYYTGKGEMFEECVKYFYNYELISDYRDFPKTSLKEFYMTYLNNLTNVPDRMDDGEMNFFMFITEASRRIPDFLEIHLAQRKKELWAWSEIIEIAKRKREIKSNIKNEEIAIMFLNLSDGTFLNRAFSSKKSVESLLEIRRDWDNLYNLFVDKHTVNQDNKKNISKKT
jgi:AcrR family transcriptional regulator